MDQKDIELFAILFFCNHEDRDLLLGKREFTYAEFCRIYYIVSFFGLDALACELWKNHSESFLQRIQQAEALLSPCQEEMQEQQNALILSEIEHRQLPRPTGYVGRGLKGQFHQLYFKPG